MSITVFKSKYGDVNLYCEYDFELLEEVTRTKTCNGCGPKGFGLFVPDSILGIDISEACNIHDWMYVFGKTLEDKKRADRAMLNNCIRLIDAKDNQWRWVKNRRYNIAHGYYYSVKRFGGPSFWNSKNK